MKPSVGRALLGFSVAVIAIVLSIFAEGCRNSSQSGSDAVEKALSTVTPLGKRGAEAEVSFKALKDDNIDVSSVTAAKKKIKCGMLFDIELCCDNKGACCWHSPRTGFGCNFPGPTTPAPSP